MANKINKAIDQVDPTREHVNPETVLIPDPPKIRAPKPFESMALFSTAMTQASQEIEDWYLEYYNIAKDFDTDIKETGMSQESDSEYVTYYYGDEESDRTSGFDAPDMPYINPVQALEMLNVIEDKYVGQINKIIEKFDDEFEPERFGAFSDGKDFFEDRTPLFVPGGKVDANALNEREEIFIPDNIDIYDGLPKQLLQYLTPAAKYHFLQTAIDKNYASKNKMETRPHWNKKKPVIMKAIDDQNNSGQQPDWIDRNAEGAWITETLTDTQHAWALPNFATKGGDMENQPSFSCWKVKSFNSDQIFERHLFS
jgi:hypothetical protein